VPAPHGLCVGGGRVSGSARRWIWPRPTSMPHAVRFWCAAARVAVVAMSGWIAGRGRSCSRAWPCVVSCRLVRLCVIRSATTGRHHQLRHAHAVEMAHEAVPLAIIQRQLGPGRYPWPTRADRYAGRLLQRRRASASFTPTGYSSDTTTDTHPKAEAHTQPADETQEGVTRNRQPDLGRRTGCAAAPPRAARATRRSSTPD
jgi:hypothetical protein